MSMQDEGIKDLRAVKIPHKELPIIENDVWIGDNVWLANGITIGSGSVLAAHAVVTKDVPPYSIVGGNPARLIRLRFPQEIVDELMDIQWWKYSLKQLSQFEFEDGIQFVESYRRLGGESLPPWTPKLVNIWNELISIS